MKRCGSVGLDDQPFEIIEGAVIGVDGSSPLATAGGEGDDRHQRCELPTDRTLVDEMEMQKIRRVGLESNGSLKHDLTRSAGACLGKSR